MKGELSAKLDAFSSKVDVFAQANTEKAINRGWIVGTLFGRFALVFTASGVTVGVLKALGCSSKKRGRHDDEPSMETSLCGREPSKSEMASAAENAAKTSGLTRPAHAPWAPPRLPARRPGAYRAPVAFMK